MHEEWHSLVSFPETLHLGSSFVSGLVFSGEEVGGWGSSRMCFSSQCCLRVVCGLFSDRLGQNLHI